MRQSDDKLKGSSVHDADSTTRGSMMRGGQMSENGGRKDPTSIFSVHSVSNMEQTQQVP